MALSNNILTVAHDFSDVKLRGNSKDSKQAERDMFRLMSGDKSNVVIETTVDGRIKIDVFYV